MSRDDSGRSYSRRALLATSGALLSSVAVAGCSDRSEQSPTPERTPDRSGTPSPTGTPQDARPGTPMFRERFDQVVNVVEAGADDTGVRPIDSLLEQRVGDDTLLVFPDGTYRLGETWLSGINNVGFVAARGANPVVVPSGPFEEIGPYFLTFINVADLHMEGLTFDFRKENHGGRVQVIGQGDFTVRDVRTIGKYPDNVHAFRFDVRNEDGAGLVENLRVDSTRQTNASVTGVYVGRQHAGELTFRDCRVSGFSDNGLYASAPGGAGGEIDGANGPVHVEGGVYRNNNVAQVRLGSTGSTARNVTMIVDEVPPHKGAVNARGLRLRARADQVIEDCDIYIGPDAGDSFGGIVFHHDSGRAYVRDTRIHVDRDGVNAIKAIYPNESKSLGPVLENVEITGAANGAEAVDLEKRDRTEFRNCCIQQTGKNRNGIRIVDSRNCLVSNTTVNVTGKPTVFQNSQVRLQALSRQGTCEEPTGGAIPSGTSSEN